jgi:hypothetical protein
VRAGELPKDVVLLVENPDRISREPFATAYKRAYEPLLSAGIEIHFISFRGILRPNHSFTDLLQVGIEHDRGVSESRMKSERCGEAWTKKRHTASGKAAMSARLPAWLKAEKGKPIEIRPTRAAIVRQIYDWVAEGIGQYQICDKLIKKNVPAWGPVYKKKPPRWTPAYVQEILSTRKVIGEYQPMTKRIINGRKQRVPDGPLVEDYYPQVVPLSLWQKVQDARRSFARTKFGERLHAGKDKFSTANLFRKLVFDVQNDAPMVYRQYGGFPSLVTTHRKNLKQHKISYPFFEKVMLECLSVADWKALSAESISPEAQELILRREKLAKELDNALKVRSRYESLLDDPEAATDERISEKYKASSKETKRLQEACSALEAEISANHSGSNLIADTEGIKIVRTDRRSVEGRTKLRLFLAQRIERIDLHFNARVITSTSEKIMGVRPGEGQIVARILFVNRATKWAIIDKDRAVLLS